MAQAPGEGIEATQRAQILPRPHKGSRFVFVGEERAPHKQNGFFCLNYGDLFLLLKVHDMGPKEK